MNMETVANQFDKLPNEILMMIAGINKEPEDSLFNFVAVGNSYLLVININGASVEIPVAKRKRDLTPSKLSISNKLPSTMSATLTSGIYPETKKQTKNRSMTYPVPSLINSAPIFTRTSQCPKSVTSERIKVFVDELASGNQCVLSYSKIGIVVNSATINIVVDGTFRIKLVNNRDSRESLGMALMEMYNACQSGNLCVYPSYSPREA